MKAMKIILPALAALLLVLVLVATVGPMPGLFIGGTPTEAPEAWVDTSDVHEIMLRVPGAPPRPARSRFLLRPSSRRPLHWSLPTAALAVTCRSTPSPRRPWPTVRVRITSSRIS